VSKDNENIFVRRASSCGIDERICNVCVVHVEVATKDTPEDTLEGRQARAIDYTSNKSNKQSKRLDKR
jgi:hypothetical protein